MAQLDERERSVLRLRFEKDLTHAEVGARLGISRARARQIEQGALVKLKDWMSTGEEHEQ